MKGGRRDGAGRKPGIKNKSTLEIKDIVQSAVDFPAMIQALFTKALQGDPACAKLLFEYGYGKPKQSIDVTSDGQSIAPPPQINVKPRKGD